MSNTRKTHIIRRISELSKSHDQIDQIEQIEEAKLTQIVALFHRIFARDEVVRLKGGFPEPFYRAPSELLPAEICFTHDYLNSCFHEIAHWCIAGKARRLKDDYGYWYSPDGRDGDEQLAFFKAESGPQALEWVFAAASGEVFRPSCDNLVGEVKGEAEFVGVLEATLADYFRCGFPPRGQKFIEGLMTHFHPEVSAGNISDWLRHEIHSRFT